MNLTHLKSIRILRLACVAALMLGASAAPAGQVKLFLLGGQSNMAGRADAAGLPTELQSSQDDVRFYYGDSWTTLRPGSGTDFGPEVTFGRTVADDFSSDSFGLIKYAAGGTSLSDDWNPNTGGTYSTFRSKVDAALTALTVAGDDYEIVGMLWTQGERDAKTGRTTAQYEADLNEFIGDVRTRYGSELPFFLSRLSSAQTDMNSTQLDEIRTAQANVAASDSSAWMIDTDAMSVQSDNLHFDAQGQMDLGEAFGQSYFESVPEPSVVVLVGLAGLVALWRRRR